ncbi:unnamed protein product [Symbiodinium sp. CCMP2592]|nr:unnamed protein product [Symbiodinium sp. CCMP2592]
MRSCRPLLVALVLSSPACLEPPRTAWCSDQLSTACADSTPVALQAVFSARRASLSQEHRLPPGSLDIAAASLPGLLTLPPAAIWHVAQEERPGNGQRRRHPSLALLRRHQEKRLPSPREAGPALAPRLRLPSVGEHAVLRQRQRSTSPDSGQRPEGGYSCCCSSAGYYDYQLTETAVPSSPPPLPSGHPAVDLYSTIADSATALPVPGLRFGRLSQVFLLLLSIERLGHVLQLLIDARMKVNIDKSVILLAVNHSYASRWRRREIASDKQGLRLRISTPSAGIFKLPIVDTHKYLGAIISYQEDCTQLTVAYRLRQTWATWTRLRPGLTSASAPALPLRLRLWQACIPPTALYALDSLPPKRQHLVQIQKALMRQLRAVARSQAHMTGESTIDLHARLRVPFALDVLRQASSRRAARWEVLPPEEHDLLSREWQTRIDDALMQLGPHPHLAPDAPTADSAVSGVNVGDTDMHADGWPCPYCTHQAPSHRLLRVHLSRAHATKAKDRHCPGRFNRALHWVNGMPICRLCGHRFNRWSGLRNHIDKGQCRCLSFHAPSMPEPTPDPNHEADPSSSSVLSGDATPAACAEAAATVSPSRCLSDPHPLAYTGVFQAQLRHQGWQALLSRPDLRSSLKHHCPLCSQWAASPSGLKVHLQQSHPEWKALRAAAQAKAQDQRELGLFQNFMTPAAGMDAAQPKRRRGEEPEGASQSALFLSHSSGSQAPVATANAGRKPSSDLEVDWGDGQSSVSDLPESGVPQEIARAGPSSSDQHAFSLDDWLADVSLDGHVSASSVAEPASVAKDSCVPSVASTAVLSSREYAARLRSSHLSLQDATPKFFWEQGFWSDFFSPAAVPETIMPKFKDRRPDPYHLPLSEPVELGQSQSSKKARREFAAVFQKVVIQRQVISWRDAREASFETAIVKWVALFGSWDSNKDESLDGFAQLSELERRKVIDDSIARKAPSTALKRANSLIKLTKLAGAANIVMPASEGEIYIILTDAKSGGAPLSQLRGFMEAITFSRHVFEISSLHLVSVSKRCWGVTVARVATPARQADPLRVKDLKELHRVLDEAPDPWDRCFAGSALFCAYGRCRWSDSQHLDDIELEYEEGPDSPLAYVGGVIDIHKTMNLQGQQPRVLEIIAPAQGIYEGDWALKWLAARAEVGCAWSQGHPTMPAPNHLGEPTVRALGSDECGAWLRALLPTRLDMRTTSHSLKATFLSYCAKRGMSHLDRLALGGHSHGAKSADTYARDALARPLRLLQGVIREISMGVFIPDANRAGRLIVSAETSELAQELGHEVPSLATAFEDRRASPGPAQRRGRVLEFHAEPASESHECEGDSSEADDGDSSRKSSSKSFVEGTTSSDSDASSSSEEEGPGPSMPQFVPRLPEPPEGFRFVQHAKLKTLHYVMQGHLNFTVCGRRITDSLTGSLSLKWDSPVCRNCKKSVGPLR